MKKIIATSLLCTSILLASNSDYNYEITPLIGAVKPEGNLDLKNQKIYGFSVGKNLSDDSVFDQLELGILSSRSNKYEIGNEDTKITRFFTNIIKEYGINDKMSFYALAGLGYERFSKERFENENDGFGNYGIGLKYKLNENVSLKADIRHLITFDRDNNLLYTLGLGIGFGEKAKPSAPQKEPIMTKKPMMIEKPIKKVILDNDKDGILNNIDKCPNTKKDVIVDNNGCVVALDLHINFDSNSADIKNIYANRINRFAALLKKYPSLKVTINAHTDSTASKKYNYELSKKRANATVNALIKLNINASRLEATGFGELKPIASNKTEEGKAKNRRVEAIIKR
jgi:OOP family OmpA-OmpF porin